MPKLFPLETYSNIPYHYAIKKTHTLCENKHLGNTFTVYWILELHGVN